jgi:hypothetical protein
MSTSGSMWRKAERFARSKSSCPGMSPAILRVNRATRLFRGASSGSRSHRRHSRRSAMQWRNCAATRAGRSMRIRACYSWHVTSSVVLLTQGERAIRSRSRFARNVVAVGRTEREGPFASIRASSIRSAATRNTLAAFPQRATRLSEAKNRPTWVLGPAHLVRWTRLPTWALGPPLVRTSRLPTWVPNPPHLFRPHAHHGARDRKFRRRCDVK